MMKKAGHRRDAEVFKGIVWKPQLRDAHHKKHGIDFPISQTFDWERILKRRDTERPGEPVRFNVLAEIPGAAQVYLAVYTRTDDWLNIVAIRRADDEERALFGGGTEQLAQGDAGIDYSDAPKTTRADWPKLDKVRFRFGGNKTVPKR